MNNNENGNRSLLASAGSRSLGPNIMNSSKIYANTSQTVPKNTTNININNNNNNNNNSFIQSKQKQKDTATRKLMMKLTLPRLRKMQALVRGFLVRRKVYPPKLQQYLLAKSVLNVVISNVVYRQASQIILQSITYLKYEPNYEQTVTGVQKMLQNQICDRIFERAFTKQIALIVQSATAEYAKLLTRPKITYGFNLRDPLQLLLFDIVNNFVGMNHKQVVRQAIQQCVDQNRQLRIIDEWIDKYDMLHKLYEEIVNQALNESIGEYIVDNLLNRINLQGAQVIARVCLDQQIQMKKQIAYNEIQGKMCQWILQQASLEGIKLTGFYK